MQSAYPDIPPGLVAHDLTSAAVQLQLDATLYPLQAIYGAAYIFIDRCYVFLERPQPDQVRVVLTAKGGQADAGALRALVGEFANELLSCAWRHQITLDNRVLLETVTMQAIAGAMGQPSLDDLASFDFSDQGFDDPLGIALSWEEKHGKKAPAAAAASEAVAFEAVASEAVASEPSEPVASEPVASEPVAPAPVAAEPVAPAPVVSGEGSSP
jgi:His-Xaa-Ser system protein HxsD